MPWDFHQIYNAVTGVENNTSTFNNQNAFSLRALRSRLQEGIQNNLQYEQLESIARTYSYFIINFEVNLERDCNHVVIKLVRPPSSEEITMEFNLASSAVAALTQPPPPIQQPRSSFVTRRFDPSFLTFIRNHYNRNIEEMLDVKLFALNNLKKYVWTSKTLEQKEIAHSKFCTKIVRTVLNCVATKIVVFYDNQFITADQIRTGLCQIPNDGTITVSFEDCEESYHTTSFYIRFRNAQLDDATILRIQVFLVNCGNQTNINIETYRAAYNGGTIILFHDMVDAFFKLVATTKIENNLTEINSLLQTQQTRDMVL